MTLGIKVLYHFNLSENCTVYQPHSLTKKDHNKYSHSPRQCTLKKSKITHCQLEKLRGKWRCHCTFSVVCQHIIKDCKDQKKYQILFQDFFPTYSDSFPGFQDEVGILWRHGLLVDSQLLDREVVGLSPGCAGSMLSHLKRIFTCISSLHSV